ncbi:MAG: LysE family transporter [Alphaproteobacteria bacterium]|nr:LysE family transporter [Alphaproteobacteria bacterium]
MVLSALLLLFLKGILIGFAIAAPVGPIGILCIRRTLSGKWLLGLFTGLGAGVADTFYGAVAGFSLVSVVNFINQYNFYLRLFGGILLIWIGFSIFRAPLSQSNGGNGNTENLFHGFTSAFFLTLSNPITLLVFAVAFAAMGVSPVEDSFSQTFALVFGVFVGACGWWLSLVTTVHLLHHKLSNVQLLWINRSSGVLLIGFAVYILGSLI